MFGKNKIESKDQGDGSTLKVNEIFRTIQGEGPLTGSPCVFVRLAGCNLACHFCDTEFESHRVMPIGEIVAGIEERYSDCPLVVLTGGEPMLQNIVPLMRRLLVLGCDIQIETAGTVWPDGMDMLMVMLYEEKEIGSSGELTIVCSPKTPKLHPKIIEHCEHYKYIVSVGNEGALDGLPVDSTQRGVIIKSPVYRPDPTRPGTIWVQPRAEYRRYGSGPEVPDTDATERNVQHAVQLCLDRGYRLSLQTHKIIGLP